MKDDWGSNGGGLWTVPQISINNGNIGNIKVKTEEVILQGGEEEWKQVRVREASVLRYKEKRQNRLFAKRIRYEVRKINAEKRPRMKVKSVFSQRRKRFMHRTFRPENVSGRKFHFVSSLLQGRFVKRS